MKRKLAWIGAILSGLYLLTAGPIPDPIPFVDEGIALAFFLKCTSYLGFDLLRFVPFFGKSKPSTTPKTKKEDDGVTIDV